MDSPHQQGDTLAIEIPRALASVFGSWTLVFTRDHVTDGKRKIYYKDATKISYSAVMHTTNFIPDSQDYKFMVGSADQEIRVEMSSTLYIGNEKRKDLRQQLVAIALHVIQPRIIENLMRRIFVNGEAVRIDDIELTREGYSRGKLFNLFGGREQVLWADAKTVPTTLRAGKVIILGGRYTKTEGFWEIPLDIPNAVVLPELMKACVNAASRISASTTEAVPPKRDVFTIFESTPTPGEPLPPGALDLRSETEKQIEISALQKQSKGAEIDSLIEELIQIGRSDKFRSKNRDGERTREIGAILDRKGGMDLMKFAYYRVGRALGGAQARTLEVAWDKIGRWLA